MHGNKSKVESLCRDIFDGVLEELRKSYQDVPNGLASAGDEARARYRAASAKMVQEADHRRERARSRHASQALFARQRDVRLARDFLVDEMLNAGLVEARTRFRDDPEKAMIPLLVEALAAWPEGQSGELRVPVDLRASLSDDLAERLATEHGGGRTLSLVGDETFEAGIRLTSPDGRLCFDNELDERFRRMRDGLRSEILRLIDTVEGRK